MLFVPRRSLSTACGGDLIAQIEASEGFDLLGPVLIEIPDWIDQRRRLDEHLRFVDMLGLKPQAT